MAGSTCTYVVVFILLLNTYAVILSYLEVALKTRGFQLCYGNGDHSALPIVVVCHLGKVSGVFFTRLRRLPRSPRSIKKPKQKIGPCFDFDS